MKITNKHHLPEPLVLAVQGERYYTEGRMGVTNLIMPPRIYQLQKRHDDEIVEDAIDRIWLIFGIAIHKILEGAWKNVEGELKEKYLVEQKFTVEVDGYTVVCKGDIYDVLRQILSDYKVTSVWKVVNEVDPDWVAQLNANNFIYKHQKIIPQKLEAIVSKQLQVVSLLRDWSLGKSMQGGNYPPTQVKRINIPIWGDNVTEAWIKDRVREHDEASRLPDDRLPECTAKERFRDPDKWAARKKANKKATKLFLREEEANDWKAAQKDGDQFVIEYRPAEDKRCKLYCNVAPFCSYAKKMGIV